jgi:hypothetical protein
MCTGSAVCGSEHCHRQHSLVLNPLLTVLVAVAAVGDAGAVWDQDHAQRAVQYCGV